MSPRRRLEDLYIVGEEVIFDDGSDEEPIRIFVRKLNSVEHDAAMKNANAARALMLTALRDPNSKEALDLRAELEQMSRESLVQYLLDEERMSRTMVVEAEVAAEEKWSQDGYLDGLIDAWRDLETKWLADNDDPEAARVFKALAEYTAEVETVVDGVIENLQADLEDVPEERLRESVYQKELTSRANIAWATEFRSNELWLSIREEDKKTLYFSDPDQLNMLPDDVVVRLAHVFQRISVEPMEGKDSRAKDDFSKPSDSPAKSEI